MQQQGHLGNSANTGHFGKALLKGPRTSASTWNLHAQAHDFDVVLRSGTQDGPTESHSSFFDTKQQLTPSNVAHLSVLSFHTGGMGFHSTYFSNYNGWLRDHTHCSPSSHPAWWVTGQDLLNEHSGQYFSGIGVTSGLFASWCSVGVLSCGDLKHACQAGLCSWATLLFSAPAMVVWASARGIAGGMFRAVSSHHLATFVGLSAVSWAGHMIHVSPSASAYCHTCVVLAHHAYVGHSLALAPLLAGPRSAALYSCSPGHGHLAVDLAGFGSVCILVAYLLNSAAPTYTFVSADSSTCLSLLCHHSWIGSSLIVGAGAHVTIAVVACSVASPIYLAHRDPMLGHLAWVTFAVGLHGFGTYAHNDMLAGLGRAEDIVCDSSIQLKPPHAMLPAAAGPDLTCRGLMWWWQDPTIHIAPNQTPQLDSKLLGPTEWDGSILPGLGTADLMLHHVHAFTIHVTVLVLRKGALYARSSRLAAAKLESGFRFPCDGPGRGGTCQVSPFDHLFSSVFWMYNCVGTVGFHYDWKIQSDVWGTISSGHPTGGDFSLNSTRANAWLSHFVWSSAAHTVQSYGTYA